jgi:hypothetical protein
MKRVKKKTHGLPLMSGILAVLLGAIALMIGWMGYGGYMFGIPAILLAIYSYKKGHKLMGIVAITFACIGIAETFAVMQLFIPTGERVIKEVVEETTPKIITAKMKEAVRTNRLTLTVESVKTTKWIVQSYMWEDRSFASKTGYKFVMIFVKVKNVGTESEHVFFWNITLTSDKGYEYENLRSYEIVTRERKNRKPTSEELKEYKCREILYEELPPGEWIEGCFFFEIKEEHNPATFSFNHFIKYPPDRISIQLTA